MGYLTKDEVLAADDLPIEDVDVEAWGGTVRVRGLTGTERDRFEMKVAAARDHPDQITVRADLVARCMVDEDGKRLFTDKETARLGAKSGAALDQVFDVIRKLSGMTDDALEAAAEDFGETPADDSGSDSPPT